MPRFHCLRALAAASLLALVHPAVAAEATRVASSGDVENPFDLDFSIKADYVQVRSLITREYTKDYSGGTATPLSAVEDRPEFRYQRRTFALKPRIAVGIYKDLEGHIEVPIILSSNTSWHYANFRGTGVTDATSASGQNTVTANGTPCASQPCPVFPSAGTVYHGSGFGDLKLGLAWGILSDARDDTKPFWLVGIDFIFPTAKMYDPGFERGADNTSPYRSAGNPGPSGENALKIDFITALSKRMGNADPYVKFHVTSYSPSSSTYSNCNHAAELSAIGQMNDQAVALCKVGDSGAQPPWIVGTAIGVEVVTGENKAEGTRVALDFRLTADYTSSSRWYNELTDMTGKLLKTEDYFSVQAFFGFYWRASKYMQLQATAHLGTVTPHFITGEPGSVGTNANFDARYDAAGTRYRVTELSDFGLALNGLLQF